MHDNLCVYISVLSLVNNDGSEFRDLRRLALEVGPSACQEQDEEHTASTSAKNVGRESTKMSYSKKNDRNRKKRKNSDSNEVICSSSSTESNSNDVSTSQKYSEVRRTRSKMRSIKEESEVGNVSLGLSTDFEVESSDNDIELVSLHVEAGKVREQNEEMNTTLHYDADAEEGLKVRNTQNGYNHSADDSKESAELNGSNLYACAETADMANESMPTGANEAAILSQSNDGHKERNEAAETSEKVPTGQNEAVPPSDSKDDEACEICEENGETDTNFHHDTDAEDGLKEDTCSKHSNTQNGCNHSADDSKESAELTSLNFCVCAKSEDMAKTSVPTGADEAALHSQSNDGYFHSDDATKERSEAAGCAEDKLARMVSEEKVPTGPNEDVPPAYSKRADSDSHDSAEAEATDMADEIEVPMTRKKVLSKQVKGNKVICLGIITYLFQKELIKS